jgi:two-component sensor histidine kinase
MMDVTGNLHGAAEVEPAAARAWPLAVKPYATATGLVAVAAIARFLLGLLDDGVLFFAIFFPAILFTALWCGRAPAIFATALSLAVVWYAFIPPQFEIAWKARATGLNLGLFCLSSGLVIWIADCHRKLIAAIEDSERRRQLLVEEIKHRGRNSIAVASTIVSRTLQHDTATANQLIDRLRIVFASPDFYADSAEVECLLHRILLTELKPYGTERFALSGEPLQMSQRQARNLALVVHELATNSAKYGGLSVGDGFLVVTWRMQSDEIVIEWKEQGRNSGAAPGNLKGFGTRLIETMVRDLKGRIERFASESGYACRIHLPIDHDVLRDEKSAHQQQQQEQNSILRSHRHP